MTDMADKTEKAGSTTAGKRKIVFVFNATVTRCVKRVEEFIANGYEVDVYAFDRGEKPCVEPAGFGITVIGRHDASMSYAARARVIYKSLRKLFRQYAHSDAVFYYFFFDVAFVARMLSGRTYIYEESDMPYMNLRSALLRKALSWCDRRIIRQSALTVMTSEGFAAYHFRGRRPANVLVVPNRVNVKLESCERTATAADTRHLRFAFVGGFRYKSVYNFAKTVVEGFPQHQFHVYGNIMDYRDECARLASQHPNFCMHGRFRNPDDLKSIYGNVDLVLAAYDADSVNAQYAEPNKLYECLFFCTPIIVSRGTYLAEKVGRLGVGYCVDATDTREITEFVAGLDAEDIRRKQESCMSVPKDEILDRNPRLFAYLSDFENSRP